MTMMQNPSLTQQLQDLKGLLVQNKMSLPSLSFVPTRTATFTGDLIAYKIRPLLEDEKGCVTMRPESIEELMDLARQDDNLLISSSPTHIRSHTSIPSYTLSLAPDSPLTSPCPSPRLMVHYLPREPIERRCEPDWRENEGFEEGI